MSFKKANKKSLPVKISVQGASGSGKTFTALNISKFLCPEDKRIALIDTENSANLYGTEFDFDVDNDFGQDVGKLNYSVDVLIDKLDSARKSGRYGVVIVDSLTHFWKEQGGILSIVDNFNERLKATKGKTDNQQAWKMADPVYRKLMNYIRLYPLHVILCVRAKEKYERGTDANGRATSQKLGLEPEFRDGFAFDLDAQFAIDENHTLVPLKHRLRKYLDGQIFPMAGENVANRIQEWMLDGSPVEPVSVAEGVTVPSEDIGVSEPEPTTGVVQELLSQLKEASDESKLKELGKKVRESEVGGLISKDDYRLILAPAYNLRSRELKAKAVEA